MEHSPANEKRPAMQRVQASRLVSFDCDA